MGETTWESHENHTRSLMPQIVQLLKLVGVQVSELDAIAVATGPGSFTGLRIGLSAAKGLAFSLNAAIVGVPTLDITASAVAQQTLPVCAMLALGRGRFAGAMYRTDAAVTTRTSDYFFGTAETLPQQLSILPGNEEKFLMTGEMDQVLQDNCRAALGERIVFASNSAAVRRACFLAELAWDKWKAGAADDLRTLSPYYIPTASLG